MRLLELNLTNFRCFESLEIFFDAGSNVCVFVGDNAAGKSAILDAIALGLAPIAECFRQRPGTEIRATHDITATPRSLEYSPASLARVPSKPFARIFLKARPNKQTIEWDVHCLRDETDGTKAELPHFCGTKHLSAALDTDMHRVAGGTGGSVPVFAYYGSNRTITNIYERKRLLEMTLASTSASRFTRESALGRSLRSVSRFTEAFEWFFILERDELVIKNEKKDFDYRLPVLEVVRRALREMLPEYSDPRTTTQPLQFLMSRENLDGTVTHLLGEQLSDGYRTMLALIMDFARRLAQANPELADPLATEAILMIDEVDLHLHPDWQQTVVPDLQRTFPNTQLILTTHSPQVLTSIHSASVKVLRENKLHAAPGGIYGAESKRTLERVMYIPSRPRGNKRVERLEELSKLINSERFDEAKALALDLDKEFEGNEPAVDEAIIEIDNRQWEKEAGL